VNWADNEKTWTDLGPISETSCRKAISSDARDPGKKAKKNVYRIGPVKKIELKSIKLVHFEDKIFDSKILSFILDSTS
jgi:hypothetical protein